MNNDLESLIIRLRDISYWKYPHITPNKYFFKVITEIWRNKIEDLRIRVEKFELEKEEKLKNNIYERFITYFMDKNPKIFIFLRKMQYKYDNTKNNR